MEKKNQKFKKKEMNCASDRLRHLAGRRFARRLLQEFGAASFELEKCGQKLPSDRAALRLDSVDFVFDSINGLFIASTH